MVRLICNIGDTVKCLRSGYNYTNHKDFNYNIITFKGDIFEVSEINESWIKSTDGRIIYNDDSCYQVVKNNPNYEIY